MLVPSYCFLLQYDFTMRTLRPLFFSFLFLFAGMQCLASPAPLSLGVCPERVSDGVYAFDVAIPPLAGSDYSLTTQLNFGENACAWMAFDWGMDGNIDFVYFPEDEESSEVNLTLQTPSGDWNGWDHVVMSTGRLCGFILTAHNLKEIRFHFTWLHKEDATTPGIIPPEPEQHTQSPAVEPLPIDLTPNIQSIHTTVAVNPLVLFAAAVFAAAVCCLCLACCKSTRTVDTQTQAQPDQECKPALGEVKVESEAAAVPHPDVYQGYAYLPAYSYQPSPPPSHPVYPWITYSYQQSPYNQQTNLP